MSFIEGYIQLIYEKEEDCFWLLVSLLEKIPLYHGESMRDARIDMKVMDDLMRKHAKRLFDYLHIQKYTAEFLCIEWFLSLFTKDFLPEFAFRIWDVILNEGEKILFRTGIGICVFFENKILGEGNKNCSPMGIMKEEGRRCIEIDKIMEIEFGIWNFSRKDIEKLRKVKEKEVDKENMEIEELRKRDKLRKENEKLKNEIKNE